jgi:hypothetical protein
MQALLTQTKSPDPKIVRQLSRMQQAIGKYAAASQEVLAESVENAWARLANHGPEIQDDAGDVSTLPLDRPRQTATTSAQLNARAKLLAIKQADRQFRHNRALHHS